MLEIASYLATQQSAGKLELKRDIIFAGWSGEELGLQGSASISSRHSKRPVDRRKHSSFHDFKLECERKRADVMLNGEPADLKNLEQSLNSSVKASPIFRLRLRSINRRPMNSFNG